MPRYVAFLRGINVGGHRIKMDELRRMFVELKLEHVVTFIASGNVIFSSDSGDVEGLRIRIEAHLLDRLGYAVPTFIRSPSELEAIAAYEPPDAGSPGSSLYVFFLQEPASDDLNSNFRDLNSEMDEFDVSGREVYWIIQGKLSESPLFAKGLGKATGVVPTTTRNMTTLRRLVAKMSGEVLG